jgi:hypothetical protein
LGWKVIVYFDGSSGVSVVSSPPWNFTSRHDVPERPTAGATATPAAVSSRVEPQARAPSSTATDRTLENEKRRIMGTSIPELPTSGQPTGQGR